MKIWKRLPISLLLVPVVLKAQTLPTVPIYTYSVPSGGYAPNGNLLSYSDRVNGDWSMQYDALNRLHTANATAGVYQGLGLDWEYDSSGNRLSQTPSGSYSVSLPSNLTSSSTYNANNQIQTTSLPGVGPQSYDAVGNLIFDGINTIAYDAENRVCAVYNTLGGGLTQYIYNAEGQRVAKGHPTTGNTLACPTDMGNFTATATYVLGLAGEQVTELAVSNGTSTWMHSNVYAGGGQLLATYDQQGLHFNLSDPLGTKRVQVSGDGYVEASWSSLPFGDGLTSTASGEDATEHHYTGKERDSESGLDYFGARYYGSNMGRFMSPDWAEKPEAVPYSSLSDPQTLNLYSYVQNNPLSKFDDDGHATVEIRYTLASGGPGYHSYLVVTDTNGHQTYFRAGPQPGSLPGPSASSQASGGSSSQSSGSGSSGSNSSNSSNGSSPGSSPGGGGPFGNLTAETGDYVSGTIDYETNPIASVTLIQNDLPAAGYNQQLSDYANALNGANVSYNPFSTNSNAAAAGAAKSLGATVPPSPSPLRTPGAGTTLPVNITPLPPPPPPQPQPHQ